MRPPFDKSLADGWLACSNCASTAPSESLLGLWDGRDYCRACIAAESPRLLAAAEASDELFEPIRIEPRMAVRYQLRSFLIAGPLMAGFLGLVGISAGVPPLGMAAVITLVVGGALALKTLGAYLNARYLMKASLRVSNGSLTVVNGRRVFQWPLQDCQWRIGRFRETRAYCARLDLPHRVVLIENPHLGFWLWDVVPCGLTAETRELWEAFFRLAGIERRK